jgi:hypothetical protein
MTDRTQNAATHIAARSTTRRYGMHGGTNRRRNEGQKKRAAPQNGERLEKQDDKRYDNYSPSETEAEPSGKRWKSSNRER